ncbi:NAD-dependent epimerase/dehydratase family protein [Neobacillus mesonae]|uniref:NAD-dependent epimerase/dehydratase family protein n=1 Tax=Neobacillus mesonae TaxID=1193713 RepID=UPI002E1AEF27|nr:NAD-dependent epimerase/dehydratase family protein [Neobacillus mesonae]MED4207559.1 NAD-dependent epimerase/dehydratase family protein [Neobacillus mesonae]
MAKRGIKRKVLVTGGAGFIGSHIVELLDEQKYEVVVVDNLSTGNPRYLPLHVKLYEMDLQNEEIEKVLRVEKPEIVIHQAAQVDVQKSMKDPFTDAENNLLATIRLLTYSHLYGVKKIIYASSCAVYGETADCSISESFPIQPISFYGVSKYIPEFYIKLFSELYGLSYTILRYANVYGPRQTPKGEGGVVSIFFKQMMSGQSPYIFGDGNQTRDFIYVKDVAMANVLAITKGENGVFNIGRNEKTSINELYRLMSSFLQRPPEPIYQPRRKGDIPYSRLDNSKAINNLLWKPKYSLIQGLEESFKYYFNC